MTFESYINHYYFLIRKKYYYYLILIEECSWYKGKQAVGVCGNPNTLNENYNSLGGTYLINLHTLTLQNFRSSNTSQNNWMFADTNALAIDDKSRASVRAVWRNSKNRLFMSYCVIEFLRKVFMRRQEEDDLSAVITGNARTSLHAWVVKCPIIMSTWAAAPCFVRACKILDRARQKPR